MSELVEYYKKNPLYKKMKLRYPVTQQLLLQHGKVSHIFSAEAIAKEC